VEDEPGRIALYYDDSAYHETLNRPARQKAGSPAGLMGRQVAGKEFFDAYLSHGNWEELIALVPNQASADSIKEVLRLHPAQAQRKRPLRVYSRSQFHHQFLAQPPATQIYFPCPPDSAFAWARQSGSSHAFSLSGVTHTLCTARAVEALRDMLTAPFEEHDRLICTSRAVAQMVQQVWEAYADHLRERHGGDPQPRIQIATIPLGVNTDKYRPATPEERISQRLRLGIADDEIAVLFVGRLSHHAKAHPFPMYKGLALAASQTGQKAHLLMMGWAASSAVQKAFEDGARAFAPNTRVSFLDGLSPENRIGTWQAADVFLSLSDNLQETFGLVIVEAMASGLPVVATDWNGYRDLVVHEETGLLVPTLAVTGSMRDLTSRLLFEDLNYDHFLARTSQAVAVDVQAVASALARLFQDPQLRLRMGRAGRQKAVEEFSWSRVIRAYESLWQEQEQERRRQQRLSAASSRWSGPAAFCNLRRRIGSPSDHRHHARRSSCRRRPGISLGVFRPGVEPKGYFSSTASH
jgi:glycosyltransferase involved in cell wall biosynthesis